MTDRAAPISHTAVLSQATAALVDEVDPVRLRSLADAVEPLMSGVADDLRQRARQAERARILLVSTLAGRLSDD